MADIPIGRIVGGISCHIRTFPQRPTPARRAPCVVCLGRAGSELVADDVWTCAGCAAQLRRAAIVRMLDGDRWIYTPTTKAATRHLEGGWRLFDRA